MIRRLRAGHALPARTARTVSTHKLPDDLHWHGRAHSATLPPGV